MASMIPAEAIPNHAAMPVAAAERLITLCDQRRAWTFKRMASHACPGVAWERRPGRAVRGGLGGPRVIQVLRAGPMALAAPPRIVNPGNPAVKTSQRAGEHPPARRHSEL